MEWVSSPAGVGGKLLVVLCVRDFFSIYGVQRASLELQWNVPLKLGRGFPLW